MSDYHDMGKSFLDMPSKPELYIMTPPPCLYPIEYSATTQNIHNNIVPVIPTIAYELGLRPQGVIDIFGALGGNFPRPEKFCDGSFCDQLHPNANGYMSIAAEVYRHIFV